MRALERWGLSPWRLVFYAIVALGMVFLVVRYTHGLGAVTNMSDQYPWGLWKALNVLAGVAIGGAGFTITATVYVFNAERFHPIVRPAVLMAFLAYSSVATALAVDIGKTWTIWHPIIMWNPHSVLFEVAWCLMLYTVVLMLEGSGMVFERLGWQKMLRAQRTATVPVVIAGVVLSTLHQSSLGTLFLIVPGKLHTIWYTTLLPVLFFVSAVAVGLSVLILLSRITANAFGAKIELPMLSELGRILVGVLGIYAVVRVFDFWERGVFAQVFDFSYESALFLVEFGLGIVLPLVLLAMPKIRANSRGLHVAAAMVVAGFLANRLNVAITGFEAAQGGHYVPAFSEIVISVLVPTLAFGAYALVAKSLRLFVEREHAQEMPSGAALAA